MHYGVYPGRQRRASHDLGGLTGADLLADPKGPVVETIGQLPALMAEVRATTAAIPGLVHQADLAMASVGGLVGGPEAPVMKALADLQATLVATQKLGEYGRISPTSMPLEGIVPVEAVRGMTPVFDLVRVFFTKDLRAMMVV